jgi:alkanesulfonate monooxygenase SsuD/methylene tetrahydromethanopterin reductase-like flavin-dependent oxidoreductase (luciferase family)
MVSPKKNKIKHGLWLQNGIDFSVQEIVECAVEAEEAGWDGIFVSDAPSWGYSDPWTVLAAIAARTKRIKIGTWITPLPIDLPWRIAHTLASLDQLSHGRVLLGVGLGTPSEYKMFTGSYKPKELGQKYDEALEIITGLWKGEPFSYSGEFFTIKDAKLPVQPVQQPRIPIVMGCWWPNKKPFRRAAQWDGIMPSWPAMVSGKGPQGEEQTGSLEEELRELLNFYFKLTDDPGEIILPDRPDNKSYRELCNELGATWLLATHIRDQEPIKQGPLPLDN